MKPVKSKVEKRLDKFQGTVVEVTNGEGSEKFNFEWQIPPDMSELQKTDSEIGPIYARMIENAKQCKEMFFKGSSFCLENDLLYRKTRNVPQMVLPMNVRNMVMKMGNTIPWAGHLGRRKMYHRIGKHFFSGQA